MRTLGIGLFFFFAAPSVALGYRAEVAEPSAEYQAITITDDTYIERTYLGDLEGVPDMYTFTTDVAISLQLQVAQHAHKKAVPFGIIIVRQNDDGSGVTEVLRQNQPLTEWKKDYRSYFGFSLLESETITTDILPGTYNIEISTPDNTGAYLFTLGDEPVRNGYFKTTLAIMRTQLHLGLVPLRILLTPFGYVPLLLIGLLGGLYFRYYYKQSYA